MYDAIQRHHPAKGAVIKDDQILMIGFSWYSTLSTLKY
ncbi:hypothetical protein [Klebsiella pneumoniae IS39]|nr:hypothetical protein [Klebsiella pneumoniae IS39]